MKRIKSACLLQTIHFLRKEDLGHAAAVSAVKEEVDHYKAQFHRSGTEFKILDETEQPDGSIMIHIKKQYNGHSCAEYMK